MQPFDNEANLVELAILVSLAILTTMLSRCEEREIIEAALREAVYQSQARSIQTSSVPLGGGTTTTRRPNNRASTE